MLTAALVAVIIIQSTLLLRNWLLQPIDNDEWFDVGRELSRLHEKLTRLRSAFVKARLDHDDECALITKPPAICDCGTVEYNKVLDLFIREVDEKENEQ